MPYIPLSTVYLYGTHNTKKPPIQERSSKLSIHLQKAKHTHNKTKHSDLKTKLQQEIQLWGSLQGRLGRRTPVRPKKCRNRRNIPLEKR